jgi:hypothetical protein
MNTEAFDFNKFLEDSRNVLLKPVAHFETMKTTGGFIEPLIKAFLYGLAAGVLYFIWGLLNFSTGGTLFGGAIGFMVLIWSIIGSVIGLFISAAIIMVISSICKGSTDFETSVRVAAAIMVLLPVMALISILGGLSFTLFKLISIIVNLYGLWMLYQGLIHPLKAEKQTARNATLILAVLIVLFGVIGSGYSGHATRRYMRNLENYDKETREWFRGKN